MLSIIICSISPERLQALKTNIQQTIHAEYEIIAVDNRERKLSSARTDGSDPKPSGSSASVSSDAYTVIVHDGATGSRVELHYGDAADCKIGQPVQQQF